MVSAQLSFATAHGIWWGHYKRFPNIFSNGKYRQQFYKIISYPLLLIVFDSRHCWYSAILLPQLMENDANSYSKNIGILLIVYSPYILVTLVLSSHLVSSF